MYVTKYFVVSLLLRFLRGSGSRFSTNGKPEYPRTETGLKSEGRRNGKKVEVSHRGLGTQYAPSTTSSVSWSKSKVGPKFSAGGLVIDTPELVCRRDLKPRV